MKRNKVLFVVLALVVALSIGLLVACDNDEACEHEYGPYALTVAPTDMLEGQAVHICSKCGYAETVVVPALTNEEVWAAVTTSATHESDGHTTYTSIYGVTTVTVGRLTDHVYDKEVEDARYLKSAADCENAAVYYKTCVCGAVGTDTFTSGEATGHTYVDDAGYPATCTTDGITAGEHCSVCGYVKTAQTVIAKTNHIPGGRLLALLTKFALYAVLFLRRLTTLGARTASLSTKSPNIGTRTAATKKSPRAETQPTITLITAPFAACTTLLDNPSTPMARNISR